MQPINESAQWMAVALSAEGMIASLSSTAEQLTGYSALDLVGHPIATILADTSAFEVPHMLKSAGDWGVWEGDIFHRNRSGTSIKAHATLAQLSTRDNCAAGFLLLSILNRRSSVNSAEADPREVADTLREIAHELNNPLAVVMGSIQLLLMDLQCEGKMRNDVERLYSVTKRLVQTVEKLHSYACALQEQAPLLKTN